MATEALNVPRKALDRIIAATKDIPAERQLNDDMRIINFEALLGHAIKELDDRLTAIENRLFLPR